MFFMLICGVTVFRLVNFYFLILPIGIVFTPILYSIGNITTEIYDYPVVRNMMWWFIMISAIFTLLSTLVTLCPSISSFNENTGYQLMLGSMPIVFIAGILGTIVGMTFNNKIVSKLKIKLAGYHYWLRAIISTAGGELVYNGIAYHIMYFNKVNIYHFIAIFLSVSIFKLVTTLFVWPIECLIENKLKLTEKVNIFDYDVNYNIFKFSTKPKNLVVIKTIDSK